jgi:polyhydroxyalkanoate synthesis repressor PhaR
MHFIKRYANRKLYDTFIKKYITLDHIEELIEQGENLEVIENGTNKDITAIILSQVITNKAKKAKEYSSAFFAEILRKGSDSLKKHSDSIKKHSDSICDYTKKIVHNLGKTTFSLEDILGTKEENNAKIEERLQLLSQLLIEKFHLPTWEDIEKLENKIQELEQVIQKLEKTIQEQ